MRRPSMFNRVVDIEGSTDIALIERNLFVEPCGSEYLADLKFFIRNLLRNGIGYRLVRFESNGQLGLFHDCDAVNYSEQPGKL